VDLAVTLAGEPRCPRSSRPLTGATSWPGRRPAEPPRFAYYETWRTARGILQRPWTRPVACRRAPRNAEPVRGEQHLADVGFHYYRDCTHDRQARGTSDWTSWSPVRQPALDQAIEALGGTGGIGDRDTLTFEGVDFTIVEAQLVNEDWTTWRLFLLDETGDVERLDVRSHSGSVAFTNPTMELVEIDGRDALLVTLFVPQEGASGLEAGQLLYYRTTA
jgi:hypothetical protein